MKSPGRIFPPHLLLQVEPFSDFRFEDQELFPARLDHLTTPFDLLLSLCGRWRVYHEEDGVPSTQIWFAFNRIIHSLSSRGFLSGPCVLLHGDLNPYNMLAESAQLPRSIQQASLTGIPPSSCPSSWQTGASSSFGILQRTLQSAMTRLLPCRRR